MWVPWHLTYERIRSTAPSCAVDRLASYWGFAQGLRHRTASGSPSTDVDDAGVAAYSEAPTGDGTPTGAGGGTLANPGTPPANGATAIKFATWRAVLSKHGRRTRYSLMAGHAYSYCGSYRLSELDAILKNERANERPGARTLERKWSPPGQVCGHEPRWSGTLCRYRQHSRASGRKLVPRCHVSYGQANRVVPSYLDSPERVLT